MTRNIRGRSSMFDAGREDPIGSTSNKDQINELASSDKVFSPTKEIHVSGEIDSGIFQKEKTSESEAVIKTREISQIARSIETKADKDNNIFPKDRR